MPSNVTGHLHRAPSSYLPIDAQCESPSLYDAKMLLQTNIYSKLCTVRRKSHQWQAHAITRNQLSDSPWQLRVGMNVYNSFIHSDHFHSASSSPLLLRGAPDTPRILCRNFTPKRHIQL